jgi:hypothetical protein
VSTSDLFTIRVLERTKAQFERLEVKELVPLHVFPLMLFYDLIKIIDEGSGYDLFLKGLQYDSKEHVKPIMERFAFLTASDANPVKDGILEPLHLSVANYITVCQALHNYIKYGDRACLMRWPPQNHSLHSLSSFWVASALGILESLTVFQETVESEASARGFGIGTIEESRKGNLPFTVETHSLKDGTAVASMHYPYQDLYEIWVYFKPSGEIAVFFKPLWDENLHHVKMLFKVLAHLELHIRKTVARISEAWGHYAVNLDDYALKDGGGTARWIKTLLESEEEFMVSFDFKTLRNSILSLPCSIQTSMEIEKASETYRSKCKDHIPMEVREALRQACVEIDEILNLTKSIPADKRMKEALAYMKRHPERFKVITEPQVQGAMKTYSNGKNRARDVKESIMADVARSFGRNLSTTTSIRNIIKSMKSYH